MTLQKLHRIDSIFYARFDVYTNEFIYQEHAASSFSPSTIVVVLGARRRVHGARRDQCNI